MNNYEELIKLIDERISKKLNSYKNVSMMTATVVDVLNDNKQAKVRYSIDGNTGTFLNKTHETLSVGDNVYLQLIDGNLSNAVIAIKFG